MTILVLLHKLMLILLSNFILMLVFMPFFLLMPILIVMLILVELCSYANDNIYVCAYTCAKEHDYVYL